jgi:pimeloyl-ACP methyl ester carboxylesterase
MSIAVVVQDLISILDAFSLISEGKEVSELSLLNFWGFSYGTIIGQYFASMYPNHVGGVVFDGVAYIKTWIFPIDIGRDECRTTDKAFASFFVYNHRARPPSANGTSGCAYYTGNSSADIYTRYKKTLFQLDPTRAKNSNWANTSIIEEGYQLFHSIPLKAL